jgi:hypothetical protein
MGDQVQTKVIAERKTVTATNANGASVSGAVDLLGTSLLSFIAPPPEPPPTLAECEAFLADVQVFVDMPWDEVLSQSGLAIIQQSL